MSFSVITCINDFLGCLEFFFQDFLMCYIFRNAKSHSQVTQWYKYRAFDIEKLSRQADFALELVKLGVERGVQVQYQSHLTVAIMAISSYKQPNICT